jgi:hypothetical protein
MSPSSIPLEQRVPHLVRLAGGAVPEVTLVRRLAAYYGDDATRQAVSLAVRRELVWRELRDGRDHLVTPDEEALR